MRAMRKIGETDPEALRPSAALPARLFVEVVIGVLLAAVLLLVAFASSHAISFVYGGF